MFPYVSVGRRIGSKSRHGLVIVVAAALFLSGCSGTRPFVADDERANAPEPTAVSAGIPSKAKRARVTSRDILMEWATFGLDPTQKSRKHSAGVSPLKDAFDVPDYTMTIDEIMTSAACRSCDEKPYHQMVVNASNRHGVPTGLIHAVIQKESGYNPAATSKKRARGLMQVTPGTGKFVGVGNSQHLYDPQTNIYAGTAYLKYLMDNHDTVEEVLAAYNSGPGNVRKYKGVPPFKETKRYVRDVKKYYSITSR